MAKEGKKAKAKLKMPKKIAGVKVSKKVRKAADPILEVAKNPIVAEIAAAALVAAAGALTARRHKTEIADKVGDMRERLNRAGGSLRDRFTLLADEMADKALSALDGLEQSLSGAKAAAPSSAPGDADAPQPPAAPVKPQRPPRAG
ncbi:hypothetical protein IC614_11410 [Allosphingosinicella flava]|uniref:Uncharacterized protein n=1 Tax=Allosphingosinicella flava TaxID=2771430 RepID=A0A7T2LM06_9SPHN|nr:hypothetical protein [Sphingosinicella flava]QPQ54908.1 hypothetical protein IC614_11410 [Sphingosinicella flava]